MTLCKISKIKNIKGFEINFSNPFFAGFINKILTNQICKNRFVCRIFVKTLNCKYMKARVKWFRLELLEQLINKGDFVNITDNIKILSYINRFDFSITQEMIYALEGSGGGFVILSNNIINTLIAEKNNCSDIRRKRNLSLYELSICVLESDDQYEIQNFKTIIKQK